ncbi:MAG: amidohydrolase family protein [Amphiplicatus sp.]
MKQISQKLSVILAASLFITGAAARKDEPHRAYKGPIIDMHLHAYPATGNGPAPNAICAGAGANLKYDPKTPWPVFFGEMTQNPPCDQPLRGPATDAEVRDQTIAAMRKLNVTGVLSGSLDAVAIWRAEAQELFVPALGINVAQDAISAEAVESAFLNGEFEVLAEVTNQYSGILADDPRFDAYWAVAAEHDIPVGIHIGAGPPGTPMLFKNFRVQSPLRMEPILNRHPQMRVYLMHAGFPFADDLKAMLYLFPQLYVDTGVLQLAATREDYYAFLEEIVRAGFGDRIMFGSDQMNWPGLIEEGIDAINNAPSLTYEQKKDILHDNAARFLRLEE